jgi:hypothetical protein
MTTIQSNEATVTMQGGGGGGGAVPVLTAVQSGAGAIQLNWTFDGATDEWLVYRSTNGGVYEQLAMAGQLPGASRAFLDEGSNIRAAPVAPNVYVYYVMTDTIA